MGDDNDFGLEMNGPSSVVTIQLGKCIDEVYKIMNPPSPPSSSPAGALTAAFGSMLGALVLLAAALL